MRTLSQELKIREQQFKEEHPSRELTWHAIHEKCRCGQSEMFVADELGEDCNAYEEMRSYRADADTCENCGQKYHYTLTRTKN